MRKTHIRKNRGTAGQPPLTQLKLLSPESRARVFRLATTLHQDDARAAILAEFGIQIGCNQTLSRFVAWQRQQPLLEAYSVLSGLGLAQAAPLLPTPSPAVPSPGREGQDEGASPANTNTNTNANNNHALASVQALCLAGVSHFLSEAIINRDAKDFALFTNLSLKLEAALAKTRLAEQHLELTRRKVALLERRFAETKSEPEPEDNYATMTDEERMREWRRILRIREPEEEANDPTQSAPCNPPSQSALNPVLPGSS
jgi:hypothetical protein